LATSGYTAPDNTAIAAVKAKTDNLPASPAAVGSAMTLTVAYDAAKTALASTAYTAPDNTSITAIKAKTDNLPASPAAVGSAMTLTVAYDAAKSALPASAYTTPPTAAQNATAVRTELAPELVRVDTTISSRFPTTSYTAPANTTIAEIKTKVDSLQNTDLTDVNTALTDIKGTGYDSTKHNLVKIKQQASLAAALSA